MLHAIGTATPAIPEATCTPGFWSFAGPVIAGNLAAAGAIWFTRKLSTDPTATAFTGIATFWLVGGLTWVAMAKRRQS